MIKKIFIGLILGLVTLLISCNNISETSVNKINNQIDTQQNQLQSTAFQQRIIDDSKEYLISKFGEKIFDEAITFSKITLSKNEMRIKYTIDLEKYVNVPENVKSNTYFYEKYLLGDLKKYVNASNNIKSNIYFYENDLLGEIILDYSKTGELLNTFGVIDCVNNPNSCPPFSINDYEEAIEIYNKKCDKKFNEVRFGMFNSFSHPYQFVWEFSETRSMRNGVWIDFTTAIDPNTGNIVWNEQSTCNKK